MSGRVLTTFSGIGRAFLGHVCPRAQRYFQSLARSPLQTQALTFGIAAIAQSVLSNSSPRKGESFFAKKRIISALIPTLLSTCVTYFTGAGSLGASLLASAALGAAHLSCQAVTSSRQTNSDQNPSPTLQHANSKKPLTVNASQSQPLASSSLHEECSHSAPIRSISSRCQAHRPRSASVTAGTHLLRRKALIPSQDEQEIDSRQPTLPKPLLASRPSPFAPHEEEVAETTCSFGWEVWQQLGKVGDPPPLPENLEDVLNSPCPFSPDQIVRDTHFLVPIPATINEKPLTLEVLANTLGENRPCIHDENMCGIEMGELHSSYWFLIAKPDQLPPSTVPPQGNSMQRDNCGYRTLTILEIVAAHLFLTSSEYIFEEDRALTELQETYCSSDKILGCRRSLKTQVSARLPDSVAIPSEIDNIFEPRPKPKEEELEVTYTLKMEDHTAEVPLAATAVGGKLLIHPLEDSHRKDINCLVGRVIGLAPPQ